MCETTAIFTCTQETLNGTQKNKLYIQLSILNLFNLVYLLFLIQFSNIEDFIKLLSPSIAVFTGVGKFGHNLWKVRLGLLGFFLHKEKILLFRIIFPW